MAGTRTAFIVFRVLYLFAVFDFCSVKTDGVELPPLSLVNTWAENISNKLLDKLNYVSGVEEVKKLYKDKKFQPNFVNGSELVLAVANKWQTMLQRKMIAVDKIVKALEDSYKHHKHNESLVSEDVEYFNAKNMSNSSIVLTYEDMFKSNVNTTYSSVQIPTDIWVGDKTVLNGIQATNSIDKVFQQNYENDSELLWQYFGSADGFYRSYPAAEWKTSDPEKDQYDVRRRGWYIQAASSPKNVMILVDTSGSTFGMTLEITKVSVSKALDTLGNDDFVNVVYFNKEAYWVSCFTTFKQANLRNKNLLKDEVKNLNSAGVANFTKGLERAFDSFRNFTRDYEAKGAAHEHQNQGAKCHKVILIFTDGGEMDEQEIFDKRNNPVHTRVFVFKVGTDSMVPEHGVRQMACRNKGYFSHIQSFGAVRLTTLDYVPVLSRPMVLSGEKHFQWSDIYLDVLGLGMMTTLTKPVYNLTGENNQQMLAVVGTDITTKNMEDTVPQRKIGPEGYAFGINSNGYILLHPRLKAEEEIKEILELGYLTEPPNVDFLEVEYDNPEEKKQLRIDMIDQKTGQIEMLTPIMSRDERYLEFVNMTYSYTFIKGTTFSVAIAQPRFSLKELDLTRASITKNQLLDDLAAIKTDLPGTFLLIAPWEFCASLAGREGHITTDNITEALVKVIKKYNDVAGDLQECNFVMVQNLLIDANITKEVGQYWIKKNETNTSLFEGVIYNLVATHGGVTRIYPRSSENWTDEQKKAIQDPWDQAYYQRALYTKNYVFAAPYNKDVDKKAAVNESVLTSLLISKAANIDVNMNDEISHAVVAVNLDSSVFDDIWISLTKQGFNNKEDVAISCINESIHCTIVDDGGFIIATNQENQQKTVGNFFGLYDGDLMIDLKNQTVFKLMKMYDFQAACERQEDDTTASAPRSIKVPTIADFINFNSWAVTAAWSFLRHFLYDIFFLGVSDYTTNYVVAENVKPSDNVSCIKTLQQFYFGEVTNASGEIECGDCNRLWRASHIEGTNLLLIVTERSCDSCPNKVLTQAPMEPDLSNGEGPNPCTAKPRYRKRPTEHCYDFHANESTGECSSASGLRSHLPLLVALHLIVLVLTRTILI